MAAAGSGQGGGQGVKPKVGSKAGKRVGRLRHHLGIGARREGSAGARSPPPPRLLRGGLRDLGFVVQEDALIGRSARPTRSGTTGSPGMTGRGERSGYDRQEAGKRPDATAEAKSTATSRIWDRTCVKAAPRPEASAIPGDAGHCSGRSTISQTTKTATKGQPCPSQSRSARRSAGRNTRGRSPL